MSTKEVPADPYAWLTVEERERLFAVLTEMARCRSAAYNAARFMPL